MDPSTTVVWIQGFTQPWADQLAILPTEILILGSAIILLLVALVVTQVRK